MTSRILALLSAALLAGCGFVHPGTPGHEPPSAGNYNPVSGEVNDNGR